MPKHKEKEWDLSEGAASNNNSTVEPPTSSGMFDIQSNLHLII